MSLMEDAVPGAAADRFVTVGRDSGREESQSLPRNLVVANRFGAVHHLTLEQESGHLMERLGSCGGLRTKTGGQQDPVVHSS